MAATAWKSPSTIVNDSTSGGSTSWVNIANLAARDNVLARPYTVGAMSFPQITSIRLVNNDSLVGANTTDPYVMSGPSAYSYDQPTADWRYIGKNLLGTFGQSISSTQANAANFGIAVAYGNNSDPKGGGTVTTNTYYAKMTGFDFQVPSGSTITGIEMRVIGEHRVYAGPGIDYFYVDAIQVRVIYQPPILPGQPTIKMLPARGHSYATSGVTPFTYPNGYMFRRLVKIDKSVVSGASAMVNFPYAFSINHPSLRNQANGGGVVNGTALDIRFELPNGTKLLHQHEYYDGVYGRYAAWVQIPSLSPTVDTEFYIYYGKPGVTSSEQSSTNIWSSNYRGVWHLSSVPDSSGTTYEHPDASPANRPLGSWGNMGINDVLEDSVIGRGLYLDGVNDSLESATAPVTGSGDFTLSIWIRTWQTTTGYIMQQRDTTDVNGQYVLQLNPNGTLRFAHYNSSVWQMDVSTSNTPVNDGQWHHIVAKRQGATGFIFIDGVQRASGSAGSSRNVVGFRFAIGKDYRDNTRFVGGEVDEPRVMAVALANDVIATEYRSQRSFYDYGTLSGPQFNTTKFAHASVSGDSTATMNLSQPVEVGASAEGSSEATARLEFPDLRASVSGSSAAFVDEIDINPAYTAPTEGSSTADAILDHSIVGGGSVAGSATVTADFSLYSPDIDKTYLYDVYGVAGVYLGSWTNQVTSPFKLPEQINTAGAAMPITLGRNPRSFGEGLDVAFNNRVVIRVVDKQAPNGKNVFQGRIVNYRPDFNAKDVKIMLESYGSQLASMLVETGESTAFEYTTVGASGRFAPGQGLRHQISTPNQATRLSAIEYRLKADASSGVGQVVRIRLVDSGGTEIDRTTLSLRSTGYEVYKFNFQNRPTLAQSSNYYVYFEWNVSSTPGSFSVQTDDNAGDNTYGSLWEYFYNNNTQQGNWHIVDRDAYFRLYKTTGSTLATYSMTELSDIIRDVMTNYNQRGGVITFDANSIENTGVVATVDLNSISILDAIKLILKHSPPDFYFYVDQGERKLYFKRLSEENEHEFKVGLHVTSLEIMKSIAEVKNVVYFTGGGSPKIYKRYARQASIDRYGESAEPLTDGRVSLESSADLVSNRFLDLYSAPRIDVAFRVADNNVDERGYDLESVIIGQRIKLGNLAVAPSTQYDMAQFDESTYDYSLDDITSVSFQVTNMTREKGELEFTLSNYPSQEDTNRTIEQLKNGMVGMRTEDNPATPSV